ncbi:hypothetical protein ANN_04743 [Periplaneta americana]|uniref:Transposase n=1 Tax=Periplaneta americana TaxID=6978 RepID=A0ABQ8TA25_PERAM|nr:hypothetical protein ANN_04743 [Periplaneta americana]
MLPLGWDSKDEKGRKLRIVSENTQIHCLMELKRPILPKKNCKHEQRKLLIEEEEEEEEEEEGRRRRRRRRRIFCGPLEKELRKRLVKCFVWSVALYGEGTWTLRRNEEKRIEAFEMWMWRRTVHVKWTDRIRNKIVFEKVRVDTECYEQILLKMAAARETRIRLTALLDDGYSISQAADRLGMAKATAKRWARRYLETGAVERRRRYRRPSVSTGREDRALLRIRERNPFMSARQLLTDSRFPGGRKTVGNRLKAAGIRTIELLVNNLLQRSKP